MTLLIPVAALLLWAGVTTVLLVLTDHAEAHHLVRPTSSKATPDQEGTR